MIVTIIVLIILATVSINAVFGQNGLISKAEQAKEAQANAEVRDDEKLGELESEITQYIPVNVEELLPSTGAGSKIEKPVKWTSNKVIAINDGTGTAVPLPEGFYYVGGDYDTGLVISDSPSDANKGTSYEIADTLIGNQFVWIPVANEADLTRTNFDDNGQPTTEAPSDGYNVTNCSESYSGGYATEASEYNTMKTQVLLYNGFYIGRYEAGVDSTNLRTTYSTAQTVVCKKGVAPYNYVPWGASMSNASEISGKSGAVYLATNFDTQEGYTSVESTLCYGCQWDAICRYIGDSNRTTPTKSGVELTGSVSTDVSKNIYDLAGNCCEWTMEAHSINNRVVRGGRYHNVNRVSDRLSTYTTNSDVLYSFRCALYISDPES